LIKKAQKNRRLLSGKSGQEEMVGFGLIIIIVAIIFIVLISLYIKKPTEELSDYEINSFIQSALQYTTTCEDVSGNLTLQKLIMKCQENELCAYKNMNPCIILNATIKNMIRESWGDIGAGGNIKGYNFIINVTERTSEEEIQFLNIKNGVVTNEYRGSGQTLPNSGGYIYILFYVYN
jgi:hypothetical protein